MGKVRIPVKESSLKKKEKIIDVGFRLMCDKGYHNVTCIDIANAAGVSTGIIYQYFKDKLDIFIAGCKKYSQKLMFPMLDILDDVKELQQLINQNDALVFIYPVFWGEAPSKLVGWFQRVWTYGFAYGNNASMKQLDKVLMLVTMGGDLNEPIRQAEVEAMKVIMFENRIGNRSKEKEMVVFDRMSRDYVNRSNNFNNNLKRAYCLGKNF